MVSTPLSGHTTPRISEAPLMADRMNITGARWSVDGAEAALKLRAVRANGDFDDYWTFHLDHERRRVHESRYVNSVIPLAA